MGEIALSAALSAIMSSGANKASPGDLTLLLSSVYVGAIVGAPLFGAMADRWGRRTTLIAAILWTALMSTAAGLSQNIHQLTVCRGLTGLAVGALPPLIIAFLADVLPPHRRGPATLWCVALATLGPTFTLLFLRAMSGGPDVGVEPWRLTFWLLAAICVIAALFALLLPESPRFLAVRGRDSEATQALLRFEGSRPLKWERLASQAVRPAPAYVGAGRLRYLVFLLFALSPWATAAFPILWGAVLTERGFALNDALLVVGLSTLGPLIGNLAGSAGVDRIDRRFGMIGCCAVMMATGFMFVTADASWQALVGAAAYGMASSTYLSILNLYGAEFFPTEGRGRQLARAWALNRLGAALAPALLVPVLRSQGSLWMFTVIAGVLVASIALTFISPRGHERLGLS